MPSTQTDRLNGLTTSVAIKPPVQAVTSANITLAGLQTVGGVALAEDNRVLVKDQADATENGIYLASTSDWTRAKDFDGNRDAVKGTLVVTDGVSTALLFYRLTTADPVIIGTSTITFVPASEVQNPYPRSQVEIDALITPTDEGYPWGHALRYGADITGTTNTTTALLNMYNACIRGGYKGYIPAGTYKVTTGVLSFDNGFVDTAWPEIETEGHDYVNFAVDSATATNAPVLRWKNGTATSTASNYWRGGSHGGITITDNTGASASSRHGIDLTGTWGIKFGWIRINSVRGNGVNVPVNLYSGSNPDPYANSFTTFEAIEVNSAAGYGVSNLNFVGMDSWKVAKFRAIGCALGGWFGMGSGCVVDDFSVANGNGWAFDDGTQGGAVGGSPQRNEIRVAELDNVQNGIRLNKTSITDFKKIRFIHRYQTSPNVSANYYPRTAISLCGGTDENVNTVKIQVFHRIEAGGIKANLGAFLDAHSSGNISDVHVAYDWADNAAFGMVASDFYTNVANSSVLYLTNKTRAIFDTRDKAVSFAAGSSGTTVPNSNFGAVGSKLSFGTQNFGTYSTNYSTSTYVFTAPRRGLYSVNASIALGVTVGTKVRMCVVTSAGGVELRTEQYSANATLQHYILSGSVVLSSGDTMYVSAEQNTASATVACNPASNNNEVRFVVMEI